MNCKLQTANCKLLLAFLTSAAATAALAFTTATVPANGIYRFTFGTDATQDGSIPVPSSAVCDVNGTYTDTFSYGFLGTTDTSYLDDVPSNLPSVPHAIDGFKVVKGQKILLHDGADANGTTVVYGPAASEYLPAGASACEGRYPVRFSVRVPERGYYAVTCTVANASATLDADVTLFSERCHTHAQHLTLAPGETKTFAWSVELAPNYFKTPAKYYYDNAVNVVVAGENAALAAMTIVQQPVTTENATIRGASAESMNVGKTMWLCDDSTGTDQRCDTPYFTLQNYAGVGSGLSRWAPAGLSIRNQGEGGLATGANTNRKSCLLKPGDYLYVEYGHNESSVASYTNNLETYLADATAAGAYLVVVSPLERHSSWNSDTSTWNRTLGGYATAGKAWVEDKIASGATNVAFIDLNARFYQWMNQESVRINGVNSSIALNKAIDFYFFSSKGGSVDGTHPNNAGADWGAYWVWKDAVESVAAAEDDAATDSMKIQAAVLSGILDGVAERVAADTPWLVSDEIIAAGRAPNSYWDQTVRAGYDYTKDAAVAAVDATVSGGAAVISGVSMRVLNQVNYAKAVIDIVLEDGSATNRWYSFYNYDASGNNSGETVLPEKAGFIDEDLDKDAAPGEHFSETLTVPAGAKAYIYFAEADGTTWQVGDAAAISAVYPFEAWTAVLLDDDCSSTSTWTSLFGGVNTFEAADSISFSMTGFDDAGTRKKSGGFAQAFADSATVSEGRIRVSFKALYTKGTIKFALSDALGTTTTPMDGGDIAAALDGTAAVFGTAANATLTADATPVAQSIVNSGEWMDVDMIIDLDAGKALASIGGADYESFSIGGLSKTPWAYFGVTMESQKAHAGAIDDVKILALEPSPKYLVEAAVNNSAYGAVEINGEIATSLNAVEGADVTLEAVPADEALYKFVEWQDAAGNTVSTKKVIFIESVSAAAAYTAVFAAYGRDEDRTVSWDFSEYAASPVAATANTSVEDGGMTIYLASGDAITADGIYWADVSSSKSASPNSETARQIKWTAPADGTLTVVFQAGATAATGGNGKPVYACLYAYAGDETTAAATGVAYTAGADTTLELNVAAGTTYTLWAYYYNRSSTISINSAEFTYTPAWCTVQAASSGNGAAVASADEVIAGKSATFTATPVTTAYRFTNWTNANGDEVSTEATYTTAITADTALTANFAAIENGTVFDAAINFAAFGGGNAIAATELTDVTRGPFTFHLGANDSLSEDGLYFSSNQQKTYDATVTGRYFDFTAPASGTVTIVFQAGAVDTGKKVYPALMMTTNDTICGNNKEVQASVSAAETDTTLTFTATAGTTYHIFPLYYNRNTWFKIKSVEYPGAVDAVEFTLAAGEGGSVAINGQALAGTFLVQKGEYVLLTATPDAYYDFSGWIDAGEAELATTDNFYLYVADQMSVTANFAAESTIDIVRTADFSTFAGSDAITSADGEWSQQVGRLEVHGAAGDTLTDEGIYWAGPGTTTSDTTRNTSGRYIKFECVKSGTATIAFYSTFGKTNSNYARIYVTDGTESGLDAMYKNNTHVTNGDVSGANSTKTVEFAAEAGKTYYIWPYFYKTANAPFYITSIAYTAAKSDYWALTVTDENGDSATQNVYHGDSVILDAPANTETQIFSGWVDGNGASLGEGSHIRVNVVADTAATAAYRDPYTNVFVWNWDVAEGAWNDAANWYYEGVIPAATCPQDATGDYVTFNTAATVTLGDGAAANEVWCNGAVTFKGGTLVAQKIDTYEHSGSLALQDAGLANMSGYGLEIDCPLAYYGSSWISQYDASAQINGNLSGNGRLSLWNSNNNYRGAKLNGDNSEAAGEIVFSGGGSRRYQKWAAPAAASSNAFWTVETGWPGGISNDDGNMLGSSGTYAFGGYSGGIWMRNFGTGTYTLEIGALNEASEIDIRSTYGEADVVKVGSANLTLLSTNLRNLDLQGGSVTLAIGTAIGTLAAADDTTVYFTGDAAWTAGTVTNLATYSTLEGAPNLQLSGLADGLAAAFTVADGVITATIESTTSPAVEVDDGEGNTFSVPATLEAPQGMSLTDKATGSITYAQAYALGLWDGTAEGEVAEPEVAIAIANGQVTVTFTGGTVPDGYTVSTTLEAKTDLAGEWAQIDNAIAPIGSPLTDPDATGEKKFYRVKISIQ